MSSCKCGWVVCVHYFGNDNQGIEDVCTPTDQIDGNVLEHFVCECILPSTVPTQCIMYACNVFSTFEHNYVA